MNTHSSVESYSSLNCSRPKPFLVRLMDRLRRSIVSGLLISLTWLLALSSPPALAMDSAPVSPEKSALPVASSAVEGDRMSALIACLPKQWSQPSLKQALNEMGNNQIERAFHLKTNPKLSQAEIELQSCMNRQGFTNQ